MHSETVTVFIPAPKSTVFQYMSDLSNMPEWAIEFCQDIKVEHGKYKASTPMGEMLVSVKIDEDSGVIDFYASPEGKSDYPLATRVLSLPDGQTAYIASFFQEPGIADEVYQQQLGSLRKEMDNIKSLFSQD